jgi:hypothetical protein
MATSPTFVATFADGEITRMTTHTRPDKLDVAHGVRLAQHAYRSRTGREPGPIVEARFEQNGTVLAEYGADQLAGVPS